MKKVLVVDDSETIRLEVKRALSAAGFSVLEAGDGAEGLDTARKHLDLALIIVDVNMPVMDGLELLDRLKGQAATAALPVVVLATDAEESVIERARKAGAKGWLVKPVKPDMLVLVANKLAR